MAHAPLTEYPDEHGIKIFDTLPPEQNPSETAVHEVPWH